MDEIERHAKQAVDRRLQHHAAHQRGNGRRGRRVGLRQPDVQRQEARLRAEARESEKKRRRGPGAGQRDRAHRGERVVAAAALQHSEAEQDGDRADVGDHEVEKSGAADFRDAMLGRDQEERRQRHRLPCHHEQIRVVGDEHERHRREEDVKLEADEAGRGSFARAEIAGGKKRDRGARCPEQQQEERGQRVEAQVKRQVGQPERQHGRRRRRADRPARDHRQREPDGGAGGEQHAADEAQIARSERDRAAPMASHAAIAAMTRESGVAVIGRQRGRQRSRGRAPRRARTGSLDAHSRLRSGVR